MIDALRLRHAPAPAYTPPYPLAERHRPMTTNDAQGMEPLLGAHALEGVFMGVDPVGKRLVPVGGWMARARGAGNGVGSRFSRE